MSKFECDQCGACCKGHLIVEVEDIDLMREPTLLAADINEKTRSKTLATVLEELSEPGRCLVIACGAEKPCPLLGPDNACIIYPTRPNACVAMEAGSEQCQHAREAEGLEPLAPLTEE